VITEHRERVPDERLNKLLAYDEQIASLCGRQDCDCLCCLRARALRELLSLRAKLKEAGPALDWAINDSLKHCRDDRAAQLRALHAFGQSQVGGE
jgi:hypothetical protein